MVDLSDDIKPFIIGIIGSVAFITGFQLTLVPPIHLLDILVFDWGLWPSMSLWKGIAISFLGLVLLSIGRMVVQSEHSHSLFKADGGEAS